MERCAGSLQAQVSTEACSGLLCLPRSLESRGSVFKYGLTFVEAKSPRV